MSVHGRVVASEPCNECGSTDNVKRYEDGYAKCFGADCGWWEAGDAVGDPVGDGPDRDAACDTPASTLIEVTYSALPKRGISEETCRRFKYGVGVKANGTPVQVAHYGNGISGRSTSTLPVSAPPKMIRNTTRITTISYGKERPIALGSDDASWAQNRRAVTIVLN